MKSRSKEIASDQERSELTACRYLLLWQLPMPEQQQSLAGLYDGNPQRTTNRPTAELSLGC